MQILIRVFPNDKNSEVPKKFKFDQLKKSNF